jgi:SPP1 family predicted phage head-tail adaptor
MIGKLRHSITIESAARTPDGAGGATLAWSTFVSTFASIEPASARERWMGHQVEADVTHKITMRYQSGITSAMRVVFGARVFQIHGITNEDERSQWLHLACEEGPRS